MWTAHPLVEALHAQMSGVTHYDTRSLSPVGDLVRRRMAHCCIVIILCAKSITNSVLLLLLFKSIVSYGTAVCLDAGCQARCGEAANSALLLDYGSPSRPTFLRQPCCRRLIELPRTDIVVTAFSGVHWLSKYLDLQLRVPACSFFSKTNLIFSTNEHPDTHQTTSSSTSKSSTYIVFSYP